MESQFINYSQPIIPSLKNTAIVSIVTSLLTQIDMKTELKKLLYEVKDTEHKKRCAIGCYNFCDLENKILNKLKVLCIPKKLYKGILDYVKPIGLQMIKCFDFKEKEYYDFYHTVSMETFYWSSWGLIDKIKALEQVVFSSNQENQETLFEYACFYCIESCIFELWRRLPSEQKVKFSFEDKIKYRASRRFLDSYLIAYWVAILENKQPIFCKRFRSYTKSHSINMLKLAIFRKNFLAVKYFWHKLAENEKTDRNILCWLKLGIKEYIKPQCYELYEIIWYENQVPSECTDIILFLLSHLSDQMQQKRFLKTYPELILKSLYNHWPYNMYLLPTINVMWDLIDVNLHMELVTTIGTEAIERNASRELFAELWNCTPENIKDRFIYSGSSNMPKIEFINMMSSLRESKREYIRKLNME